jgi:hypothetical protein
MRTLLVLLLLSASPGVFAQSDAARRSILEEELAAEAAGYADAYSELKSARKREASARSLEDIAERVNRHRRNMAELAREIARADGDPAGKGAPRPPHPAKSGPPEWLIPAGKAAP